MTFGGNSFLSFCGRNEGGLFDHDNTNGHGLSMREFMKGRYDKINGILKLVEYSRNVYRQGEKICAFTSELSPDLPILFRQCSLVETVRCTNILGTFSY